MPALFQVDEVWGTKKDKEEKKRKKEESASFDPRATRDLRKLDKKKDDVEVEGQGLLLFEEDEVNDDQKPQFAGHVVAVVERAPGQLFSGMLGVLRPSSAATQQKQDAERREREGVDLRSHDNGKNGQPPPKIIWFRPTDKRVPLIAIREWNRSRAWEDFSGLICYHSQPPIKLLRISFIDPTSTPTGCSCRASNAGLSHPCTPSVHLSKSSVSLAISRPRRTRFSRIAISRLKISPRRSSSACLLFLIRFLSVRQMCAVRQVCG